MNKLKRAFLSRKTTITLIALQALVYFMGAVIPQRLIMNPAEYQAWQQKWPTLVQALESLGFNTIFSSWLTYTLTTLFFLHLVLVTWQRLPAIRSAIRLPEQAHVTMASLQGLPVRELTLTDANSLARLRQEVTRLGFTIVDGDGCFRGIKNTFSPLGSLLFHVSFIIILAGAVVIFHSRFSGGAYVTEGQEFHGTPQEYFNVRRFSHLRTSYPPVAFRLVSIRPEFEKNEAISIKTEILPLTGQHKGLPASFNVNFPYSEGSMTMLIKDIGVAPYFDVRDQAGRELLSAFISLNILKGDVDHFVIPGTSYEVRVQFWPEYDVDSEGYIFSRSYYIKRPLFKITILKQGVEIADGKLHSPAEQISFEGLTLAYREIRYFGTFNVTDEHGGEILVTGFVIALVGLVLKFMLERQELLVLLRHDEERIYATVGYKSEYYSGSRDKLFDMLEKAGG